MAVPLLQAAEPLPKAPRESARIEWRKLMGQVETTDLNAKRLRLRDKNGNVTQVTIDENVQIFRYWRLVAFKEIRPNDHVILKRAQEAIQ